MDRLGRINAVSECVNDWSNYGRRIGTAAVCFDPEKGDGPHQGNRCLDDDDGRYCTDILPNPT